MVKVLIVGATGFLGNLIAKEAVKLGHQVTALVSEESLAKKKETVEGLKAAGVQIKTGSLESDHKDLVALLKTVEVVGWCLFSTSSISSLFLHSKCHEQCRPIVPQLDIEEIFKSTIVVALGTGCLVKVSRVFSCS